MNILIIHRYFWPESGAAEEPLMLKDIALLHLSRGDAVDVVCGYRCKPQSLWKNIFSDKVKFHCFYAEFVDREGGLVNRIINYLKLIKETTKFLFVNNGTDIIYSYSYPPGLVGLLILYKKLLGRNYKIIYTIQDILDYRIRSLLLLYIYQFYMKFTILETDVVITLSEDMRLQLLSLLSERDRIKIHVINNFYTRKFSTDEKNQKKKIDIIYAGNHGKSQNLFYFMRLIRLVQDSHELVVSFYGNGEEKQKMICYARNRGINIDFYDPLPHEIIAAKISEAKLGLVSLLPGLEKYAFPSKIAAYCFNDTKILLISNSNSSLSRLVNEYQLGHSIDPTNENLASFQLINAIKDENNNIFSKISFRNNVNELFSRDIYLKKLSTILDELAI